MKTKIYHIFLTLILTLAVTDYVWIEIFENDKIVSELEIEKEKEYEEELKETKSTKTKLQLSPSNWAHSPSQFSLKNQLPGFIKHGNSFCPKSRNSNPKLFILHQQLRLHS